MFLKEQKENKFNWSYIKQLNLLIGNENVWNSFHSRKKHRKQILKLL